MTIKVANRDVVEYAIRGLTAEGYGNTSTMPSRYGFGYLPYRLSNLLFERGKNIRQTIYSYGTPIAWLDGDMWIIPDVRYSVTTGKHQGYLWRLPNHHRIPYDISMSEYLRVLEGKTVYLGNRTYPGPKWTLD